MKTKKSNTFVKRLARLKTKLNFDQKKQTLSNLRLAQQQKNFWQNQTEAQKISTQISHLEKEIDSIAKLKENIDANSEIKKLLDKQPDPQIESDLHKLQKTIRSSLKNLEYTTYLSGKYDKNFALLSIHSGQGGTDAMDWAAMLQRMYAKYFNQKKWPYQILDVQADDEAGIKSVYFQINQAYAYGYLKNETGTHRLVRLSPFNADSLRQTSFAKVEIMPLLEKQDEIQINPRDIEFSAFRAGGRGGQNVNKVSTAVRLTHTQSQITVACQSQRSQEQNRQLAMQMLQSKLWAIQQQQQLAQHQSIKGDNVNASWGQQIRSYVLHPYKMVKDLRTGYTSNDPVAVLNGKIDSFIKAELKL